MTFWVSYVHATHAKVNARFRIINQLEKDWKIKGHRDVPKIRDMMYKPRKRLKLKTYFLETQIFYVYSLMALLLTVYRCVDKWTICKALAIGSLLPVLVVIIGSMVIACRYDCSIRKGEDTAAFDGAGNITWRND